jgi:predicted nucleic acid-binding protein
MRLVVADTSPIFYLLSIGHIDLLPQLFGKVFVPHAVHQELCHPDAPLIVRDWVAALLRGQKLRRLMRSTMLLSKPWAPENGPPSRSRFHCTPISF